MSSRSFTRAGQEAGPPVRTRAEDVGLEEQEGRAPATLRELVRSDVDRYVYMLELDGTAALPRETRLLQDLRAVLMCQGLQASVVHRVGHALATWAPGTPGLRLVRLAGRLAHWVANRVVESTTGISISEHADIGRGLYIGHFGGVIVGAVRIGEHVNISHGVTIGRSGRGGERRRPVVGDRVWIGPGAVVAGHLTLGEDSVVGANSVVTRSVPARASALGAPARVRPDNPSFGMVVYRGAEQDPARRRSLDALPGALRER